MNDRVVVVAHQLLALCFTDVGDVPCCIQSTSETRRFITRSLLTKDLDLEADKVSAQILHATGDERKGH